MYEDWNAFNFKIYNVLLLLDVLYFSLLDIGKIIKDWNTIK